MIPDEGILLADNSNGPFSIQSFALGRDASFVQVFAICARLTIVKPVPDSGNLSDSRDYVRDHVFGLRRCLG
jgi:hypothetical protein